MAWLAVVAQQEAPGFLVSDARDVLVEEEGCAGVVGVVVRVDEVGDLVAHAVADAITSTARWML